MGAGTCGLGLGLKTRLQGRGPKTALGWLRVSELPPDSPPSRCWAMPGICPPLYLVSSCPPVRGPSTPTHSLNVSLPCSAHLCMGTAQQSRVPGASPGPCIAMFHLSFQQWLFHSPSLLELVHEWPGFGLPGLVCGQPCLFTQLGA